MAERPSTPLPNLVYKVLLPKQFEQFRREGELRGSADDLRDGYIHLSFAHQLEATIDKHFGGRTDVVVAEFDVSCFGQDLRCEESRGRQLFPHLYGYLRLGDVKRWLQHDQVLELMECRGHSAPETDV